MKTLKRTARDIPLRHVSDRTVGATTVRPNTSEQQAGASMTLSSIRTL